MSFWDEGSTEEYFDNNVSIEGGNPAVIVGLVGFGIIIVGILVIVFASYWDEWFTDNEQIPAPDNAENEIMPTEMSTKHWVACGGIIGAVVGAGVVTVSAGILGGAGAARAVARGAKSTAGFYVALIIIMIIGIIVAVSAHYYDKYFKVLGKDKKVTFAHTFGPAGSTAQSTAMWVGIGIAGLAALIMIGRIAFKGGKKGMKAYDKYQSYKSASNPGGDYFEDYGMEYKDDEEDIYKPLLEQYANEENLNKGVNAAKRFARQFNKKNN